MEQIPSGLFSIFVVCLGFEIVTLMLAIYFWVQLVWKQIGKDSFQVWKWFLLHVGWSLDEVLVTPRTNQSLTGQGRWDRVCSGWYGHRQGKEESSSSGYMNWHLSLPTFKVRVLCFIKCSLLCITNLFIRAHSHLTPSPSFSLFLSSPPNFMEK